MLVLFPELAIQNTVLENKLRGTLQLKHRHRATMILEKIIQKGL